MKTIAIEEHFSMPATRDSTNPPVGGSTGHYMAEVGKKLRDLGEDRLADMDAAGIDMQVLSLSAVEGIGRPDSSAAAALVRNSHDMLAEAIRQNPQRLAGFAVSHYRIPKALQPNLNDA